MDKQRTAEAVAEAFPFKDYFADTPAPLFSGASYEAVRQGGKGWRLGTGSKGNWGIVLGGLTGAGAGERKAGGEARGGRENEWGGGVSS